MSSAEALTSGELHLQSAESAGKETIKKQGFRPSMKPSTAWAMTCYPGRVSSIHAVSLRAETDLVILGRNIEGPLTDVDHPDMKHGRLRLRRHFDQVIFAPSQIESCGPVFQTLIAVILKAATYLRRPRVQPVPPLPWRPSPGNVRSPGSGDG